MLTLSIGYGYMRKAGRAGFAKTLKKRPSALFSTSAVSPKTLLSVEHPAYDIIENTAIDEYGIQAILYNHKKSGAQVMSVIAPDENKVFGITLRTPPKDSTGVPHILEHSVLCGSRKVSPSYTHMHIYIHTYTPSIILLFYHLTILSAILSVYHTTLTTFLF